MCLRQLAAIGGLGKPKALSTSLLHLTFGDPHPSSLGFIKVWQRIGNSLHAGLVGVSNVSFSVGQVSKGNRMFKHGSGTVKDD